MLRAPMSQSPDGSPPPSPDQSAPAAGEPSAEPAPAPGVVEAAPTEPAPEAPEAPPSGEPFPAALEPAPVPPAAPRPGLLARLRGVATALLLLAGLVVFALVVHRHYPIQKWLFWRYAGYWLAALVFATLAYGLGHLALTKLVLRRLPLLEHAIVSFALGVFGFELAMFVVGAAQGFRKPAFFLVPAALLAVVARPLWKHAGYVRRVLERKRRRAPLLGAGLVPLLLGVAGLAMVYFLVLTPENIQFDARWKHMGLAEDYVAHGGIHPAVEGYVFSARPHFTSYLYSWAFLLPGGRLFDKMELAAHLEFAVFLFTTVVGVGALVRRLVPRADPRWVWAARFVFPGVFLYDSSVSGGADHVGAMYGVPIALCLFRVVKDLDLRFTALMGVFMSAAALTKETIAFMLVPTPILFVGGRALLEAWRARKGAVPDERRGRWWKAPLLLATTGVVASSPLWLKNFVFYGDPLYPVLHRFLSPHPFTELAGYRLKYGYLEGKMWSPSRDLDGLLATFKTLVTFSFKPNDWKKFHGVVPVFGSLFTLFLVALPFLKRTKRIWILVAWIHVAIFTWYSIHHQDRYLQGLLPLMAAATLAMALLAWRTYGKAVRTLVVALFGFQLVWGGDVWFLQTHAHAGSPLKKAIDLLSAGHGKKYDERFAIQSQWQRIGGMLPEGSKLLLHLFHEHHAHLGTGVETVLDNYLWQFGIEYGTAGSPEGVRQALRDLGVTHVFASPSTKSDGVNSFAADILFHELAGKHTLKRKTVGSGVLGELPDEPLTAPFVDAVAVFRCTAPGLPRGLYRVSELTTLPFGPDKGKFPKPLARAKTNAEVEALLDRAGYVIVEKKCTGDARPAELTRSFELMLERRGYSSWPVTEIFRRRAKALPAGAPAARPPPPRPALPAPSLPTPSLPRPPAPPAP